MWVWTQTPPRSPTPYRGQHQWHRLLPSVPLPALGRVRWRLPRLCRNGNATPATQRKANRTALTRPESTAAGEQWGTGMPQQHHAQQHDPQKRERQGETHTHACTHLAVHAALRRPDTLETGAVGLVVHPAGAVVLRQKPHSVRRVCGDGEGRHMSTTSSATTTTTH